MTEIPKELQGDIIEEAFERAEFVRLPKVEQDKYHQNLKVYRDLVNSLDTAHESGYKKGQREGMEQGIVEVAKNLLEILDNKTIALKTALTVEQIEALREKG